ncbi:MAG: alpha-glucosidase C-terminal domain-containing protein [Bacteroidales bacterium]|nr:alpha-glucosidase C-terminal domain-containing protein [Bacteroidales bacterium]
MKKTLILLLSVLCLAACHKEQAPRGNFTSVRHPEWAKNAVIYQINVRQFSPEGTFAAVEPQLDRLSGLGVDILWLMPIHPIGVEGRKGTLGSYYAVKDYCAVNPEFGTLEDFDHFLKAAHDKGFKVILDWVANHTGRDHAWTVEHRDWYFLDSLGNLATQYDWTDIAHLNYADNPELYDAMEQQMKFWIDRGVDGFRCDVASEVPTDFWEKAFADFRAQKPEGLFFLAEAEAADLQENAFDAYYGWQQMHLWYDMCAGKKNAKDLADFYVGYADQTGMPIGTWQMNFLSNHDQNSWSGTNTEMFGDAVKQYAVLSFLIPGIPMLYNGDEVLLDKRLEFFEKDPIDWSGDPQGMTTLYTELIKLRDNHACLWAAPWGGTMAVLPTDHPEQVFAFEREEMGDMCLAMFNFSDQPVSFRVENHLVTADCDFTLPAHGYHIIFSVGDCFGDCDESEFENESE